MQTRFLNTICKNRLVNFARFERYLSNPNEQNKDKGDLFECLCYCVFKLHPYYKDQTQNVWLYKDVPLIVKRELSLPEKDMGIDIIIQDYKQRYFAVQCKFRSNKSLTWEELSTFAGLTFGSAKGFYKGILMSNSGSVPDLMRTGNFWIHLDDFWNELPRNFMDNCRLLIKGLAPKFLIKEPRDFQTPIINDLMKFYDDFNNQRGILEVACGGGKTLIAYLIDQHMQNSLTLFLIPSLYLLSQTYTEWKQQDMARNIKRKYLLIGSDVDADIKEFSLELQITTNTDCIRNFINEDPQLTGDFEKDLALVGMNKKVIIATYQSSPKIKNLLDEGAQNPDFIIFDEAHKTCGQVGKEFSTMVRYRSVIPQYLFMTATPSFYEGDQDVISMKKQEIYGPIVSSFNLQKAIECDALTDYQVLIPICLDSDIEYLIKDRKIVFDSDIDVKADSEIISIAIIVAKTIQKYKSKKILTYHNTVKNAQLFRKLLSIILPHLGISARCLFMDGTFSMKKRKNIVSEFRSASIAIICSAQVLNEGVDIPCIDTVSFIDPRKSTRDIIQCIGRCLRKFQGKDMSYVIIPEILNQLTETDDSRFSDIWSVIRALRKQDGRVIDYISDIIAKRDGKKRFIFDRILDNNDSIAELIDVKDWQERMIIRICQTADPWEIRYQELQKFIEDNDRLPSAFKNNKNLNEKRLGSFISTQRKAYKGQGTYKITQDRIDKLNTLKYWFWDLNEMWNNNFRELQKFIEDNNRLPVEAPKNKQDLVEKRLGNFITAQRKAYKGQGTYKITQDRIDKLNTLKYWFWEQDLDADWNKTFQELRKFIENNNRLPSRHNKQDLVEKRLGYFIMSQRHVYKKQDKTKITQERIDKLNTLKYWFWKLNLDEKWDITFRELQKFIEDYSRLPIVSKNNKQDSAEKRLGQFISNQRKAYKGQDKTKISQERIDKLNTLKYWFWEQDLDKKWNITFQELQKFIEDNDRLPSLNNKQDPVEKRLGIFITVQRGAYKGQGGKKISQERIDKLNTLKYWFWKR